MKRTIVPSPGAAVVHTHTEADVTSLTADLAAKAPLASPAFTGTPTGITKAHVGLGNVDNTSDANKPVSTATQTALDAKPYLGRWITPVHGGVASTSQTFTVGRVLLCQFVVPVSCQVNGLSYMIGAAAAGNVIGGIVGPVSRTGDTADAGAVIAQSASTAQAGTNTYQLLTWTAVTLAPGVYYAALEGDNATGTYHRHPNQIQAPGLASFYDRSGGYGALTDPTPTTTSTGSAVPGLRVRLA